mgnify:CR=1 FL=1
MEDRPWIAEDQVFIPVKDAFLLRREVLCTEKTLSRIDILPVHRCQGIYRSPGIMLEADGKPIALKISRPHALQRPIRLPQFKPRILLLGDKIITEALEISSIKVGIYLVCIHLAL